MTVLKAVESFSSVDNDNPELREVFAFRARLRRGRLDPFEALVFAFASRILFGFLTPPSLNLLVLARLLPLPRFLFSCFIKSSRGTSC